MAIGSPTMLTNGRAPRLGAARADERWRGLDAGSSLSRFAGAVLAGSLIAHATLIVAALLWVQREPPVPPPPIPVELVQEPSPPKAPPPGKPPAPEPLKPQPPKPRPPKPESPKPASPKPEPPKPEPPKPEPPKPTAAERQAAEQRDALQRELAALKAERRELTRSPAETAAAAKAAQEHAAADKARAALLDSIQGLALPATAADGDVVVGYKTLVFSQLAKAKDDFPPGTVAGVAGVTFAVADDGALGDVKVAVSSGVKSLDDEAEAIVRHASPFPRPPEGAQRSFSVNVSFAVLKR